jgi:hypothetical protein
LIHALIGGVQPHTGWWAPVAQHIYKEGAGALGTRFTVVAATPPETLTDPEGSVVCDWKLHRYRHWLLLMPDTARLSSTPAGLHCFHYTDYYFTKNPLVCASASLSSHFSFLLVSFCLVVY